MHYTKASFPLLFIVFLVPTHHPVLSAEAETISKGHCWKWHHEAESLMMLIGAMSHKQWTCSIGPPNLVVFLSRKYSTAGCDSMCTVVCKVCINSQDIGSVIESFVCENLVQVVKNNSSNSKQCCQEPVNYPRYNKMKRKHMYNKLHSYAGVVVL